MGQFRIEVTAVGGHGDRRDIGDGGTLDFASLPEHSIDKAAAEFVEKLRSLGASVSEAKLTHWPGQPSEVVDDLITNTRAGSF